jgi:hypothetical protein
MDFMVRTKNSNGDQKTFPFSNASKTLLKLTSQQLQSPVLAAGEEEWNCFCIVMFDLPELNPKTSQTQT